MMSGSQEISFKRQYNAENRLAEEHKLEIISAPAGTRFATLVRNSPPDNYPEEQLHLMNRFYPGGEPKASQLLKVVR
ncbi:MAG: hypothetical protein WBN57_06940 [Gammaproteobacteria bacterium]